MTDRDRALLALRPSVATKPASGVEGFLHETLRPVLKLQNPVLLALVSAEVRKRVAGFAAFAPDDQRQRLAEVVRRDSRLKQVLFGVVLGVLTSEERAFALAHEAEVRRRILALIAERAVSQTEAVASSVAA